MAIQIRPAPILEPKGRALNCNTLHVPNDISWEGERLTWKQGPFNPDDRGTRVTDRLLSAFVKLGDADPETIVGFAKRYGVFGLAQLNRDYRVHDNEVHYNGGIWLVGGVSHPDYPCWEPLDFWRQLSTQFSALLRIASALRKLPPQPGLVEDWNALGLPVPKSGLKVQDAQFHVLLDVNEWLKVGRVGLVMSVREWSKRRTDWMTEVSIGTHFNLAGGLALQLMTAISGAEALETCDGCKLPYIRSWKAPNPGSRNFCDDCSADGKSRKQADERRKESMVAARRLCAEGMSVEQIAISLGKKVETIEGWVRRTKANGKA